jgi:3-hydroxybutyryl-CoA dehydrogenase
MADPAPPFRRILVVGTGTMGKGIAALTAARGIDTMLFDADPDALAEARQEIHKLWDKAAEKQKMTTEEIEAARHRLHCLQRLAECASAGLVLEAIPEAIDLKMMLFRELDELCREEAIFATNTSSLSVTKIAAATHRRDRVVGVHFFNPVAAMPLVELVSGAKTSAETLASARSFALSLGKKTIEVRDSPGFATSRLGLALGLEAMRMLEEGIASAADIDLAMEAGYGHAMGPLKTSDLVGLDVRLSIAETLASELCEERFHPPAILRRLVAEGKTGRKAGSGFYRWDGNRAIPIEHRAKLRNKPGSREKGARPSRLA